MNHLLHECIVHEDSLVQPASNTQQPSNAQLKIKPIAEPYEEELASLACSLCSRIKTQPDLLPLFFHDKRLSHRTRATQEGKNKSTIHVRHDDSPGTSSPTRTHLSPHPPLSQCSSQASLSSATSVSEVSEVSPSSTAPTTNIVESREYTFLVFDFLIRLLHRHGRIGELARTGLLFVIDLAMSTTKVKITSTSTPPAFPVLVSSKVGKPPAADGASEQASRRKPKRKAIIGQSDRLSLLSYIEDSDFADVLGAGLGAAFAVLPSHLYVPIPTISSSHATPESSIPHSPSTSTEAHDGIGQAMREHGISVFTDHEVKESLELFVAVINFATDVTSKAPKSTTCQVPSKDTSDSSTASVSAKMRSLVDSISASFGSVFLQNALLPRLVDAASPTAEDAAIIAVLTYTYTLIQSLEPETPLFEEAMAALLSRQNGDSGISKDKSAMRDNLRRILAYSLTPHVGSKAQSAHRAGPLSNSLSTSMQLCALRLLYSLLEKADWASLHILSIQPSLGCTRFPFCPPEDEDQEDVFVYPGGDDDSDRDSFIYPSEEDHRKSIAAFTATSKNASRAPRKHAQEGARLDVFLQLVSSRRTPSLSTSTEHTHRKSVSRHSSRSSLDAPRHSEFTSHNGMSFEKYLKQAELAIQRDQSFIRGVAVINAFERESAASHNVPKILSMLSPSIQVGDLSLDSGTGSLQSDATLSSDNERLPLEDRMIQHKLELHLGLMAQLHTLLSTFFVNEPAVNLSLTRTFAKLAVCPYRSLEGWLVPEESGGSLAAIQNFGFLEKLGLANSSKGGAVPENTSRPGNENTKVTDWLRQNSYTDQAAQDYEDPGLDSASNPSILYQYATLLKEVQESHRTQIKEFDRLLHERRQNMLFVEDLAEAMQGESGSGSPSEATSSGWHIPFTSMARIPGSPVRSTRQRVDSSATERDYVNSLSPYATHLRETSTKLIMVRLETSPSEDGPDEPSDALLSNGAPLSKFWSADSSHSDHNDEAGTALAPQQSSFGLSPSSGRLNVNTNLMLLSDLKSPLGPPGRTDSNQAIYHEVPVNLSKYLDNLVILEESLKELVAIITVRLRIGIDPIV